MTPEMMEKMVGFTSGFGQLLMDGEPVLALRGLVSTFSTCYSMLNPEARSHTALLLLTAMTDIGEEVFEDHADFRSFVKEMVEKHEEESE